MSAARILQFAVRETNRLQNMSISVYLKDIGRGAAGARSLSAEAARDLMRQVLTRQASAAQIGAFVLAMRMKGETLPCTSTAWS
jgi:hypothetical protein